MERIPVRNIPHFHWLKAVSFLLLLQTSGFAAKDSEEHAEFAKDSLAIETAYKRCDDSVGESAWIAMAECAAFRKYAWDQELNKVYKLVQKLAVAYGDTLASKTLKAVQKKWPTFRDADMGLCLDWYAYEKGPSGRIQAVYCQGSINRDRAIWILALLDAPR